MSKASFDGVVVSFRASGRIAALFIWFLVCVPPHLVARAFGRSRWPRRFLAGAARIVGAKVRVIGAPAGPRTLLVANHLSWLDIPVLAAATGCRFVAKKEVRDHRLLRWIADQNATIYVQRSDRHAIGGQVDAIAEGLGQRQPVALFPEGTTGDGRDLLPFRSPLFAAVAPPPNGVKVRPVAIAYGAAAPAVAWTAGEAGLANALRILGRAGRLPVTIHLLEPLRSPDRKRLAFDAQAAIAAALAASAAPVPAL